MVTVDGRDHFFQLFHTRNSPTFFSFKGDWFAKRWWTRIDRSSWQNLCDGKKLEWKIKCIVDFVFQHQALVVLLIERYGQDREIIQVRDERGQVIHQHLGQVTTK